MYFDFRAITQRVTPDMTYVTVALEERMQSTTW
jgi:hypothetical protein